MVEKLRGYREHPLFLYPGIAYGCRTKGIIMASVEPRNGMCLKFEVSAGIGIQGTVSPGAKCDSCMEAEPREKKMSMDRRMFNRPETAGLV